VTGLEKDFAMRCDATESIRVAATTRRDARADSPALDSLLANPLFLPPLPHNSTSLSLSLSLSSSQLPFQNDYNNNKKRKQKEKKRIENKKGSAGYAMETHFAVRLKEHVTNQ